MSAADRAKKAQALINEVNKIPPVGMSNYKNELEQYRRILTDLLVLIRDDAIAEDKALASVTEHLPLD